MTDGFPSQKASNAASVGPMLVQRWHTTIGITLCQRWPNVSVPTLGRCWHNVGPTLACKRWANWQIHVGPTLVSRRWPNVRVDVGPTLGQRRNASWVIIQEFSNLAWLTGCSTTIQSEIKFENSCEMTRILTWNSLSETYPCCYPIVHVTRAIWTKAHELIIQTF